MLNVLNLYEVIIKISLSFWLSYDSHEADLEGD